MTQSEREVLAAIDRLGHLSVPVAKVPGLTPEVERALRLEGMVRFGHILVGGKRIRTVSLTAWGTSEVAP